MHMNFKNKRFITAGVDSNVSPLLQLFMWHCIDAMPPPKDYLQVFELSAENGKVKINLYSPLSELKKQIKADRKSVV